MRILIVLAVLSLALSLSCSAAPIMHQVVTTSWHGLSGLYVIPTARTVGPGKFAIGFNESKHAESIEGGRYVDRQIRGVGTYGISDKIEISATYFNNMYVIPPNVTPMLSNQHFHTFSGKIQILQEHPHYWYPAVALGVRDITNDTADVGPLRNVNNGTKGFIVASKKVLKDDRLGRFMDCHAGLTFDRNTSAGFAGIEFTLAPNASLIIEGVWDAPYLNFRKLGTNDLHGRYIFDVGLRMYPELVPGLVLDTGFVGDGEFEFSFGASYVISL